MHISIPEPMRKYIESRTRGGSYSASDYICALIRHDQLARRKQRGSALSKLVALGMAQLERGEGKALDVDAIIRRVEGKYARSKKNGA